MEVLGSNIIGYYNFKTTIDGDDERCDICLICHSSFYKPAIHQLNENKDITLPDYKIIGCCGHVFHENCIEHNKKNKKCPLCSQKWVEKEKIDSFTNLKIKNSETVKIITKKIPIVEPNNESDDESEDNS